MRFVAVESDEQRAAGLVFRNRDLLVRQRTQMINATRGHMAGYNWVAPPGTSQIISLGELIEGELGASLPTAGRAMIRFMFGMLGELDSQVRELDKESARRGHGDEISRRLMTIPGIGPIAATAIVATAPAMETFRRGSDVAAWLGLAPRQQSTGGKTKLGRISKMSERTLRRLLIFGAITVVQHASRRGAREGSWLASMLNRKPRMLATVAQANKTADRLGGAGEQSGLQSSGSDARIS